MKNKIFKRPSIAAIVLIVILSLSVIVYAAAPVVVRYLDTRVTQGEEFVNDFYVYEFEPGDGTVSRGIGIDIDYESLEASGGGAIIVEVEDEELIILDELIYYDLDEGLALLQLENPLLPVFLPEGFTFSKLIFPVNPNNHEFRLGNIPTDKHAYVYYENGDDIIELRMAYIDPAYIDPSDNWTKTTGEQNVIINGYEAALMGGSLTHEELEKLEWTVPFEPITPITMAGAGIDSVGVWLIMYANDIMYSLLNDSGSVTLFDLVRIAESMK